MQKESKTMGKTDRELVVTRLIDAPRDLVFEVWTDPEHIKHWWGPNGFTNTIGKMDVRPGGVWEFVMHGPDGTDYKNKSVYVEIVKPERIVLDHVSGPTFRMSITFAAQGDKTLLTIQMIFESTEQKNKVIEQFGADEGLKQNVDRLQSYMKGVSGRSLIITRILDAPRELVWKVWTDSKHVAHWWGPNGFKNTIYEMDVRPGGVWRFMMHSPDGRDYPNKIIFNEVMKPERLVYKHSDDEGFEPVNFDVTVTFEKQGNKTKLTMRMTFSSAAELERVSKEYGAIEGAHQHVGRLVQYLATMDQDS